VYVCICNAVTDRDIRGAVARGARSLEDLAATLGVATRCRKCTECAQAVLADAVAALPSCAAADD
jgi:bacterioferritin-associated ferredoxin